jgi:hypothetical protein
MFVAIVFYGDGRFSTKADALMRLAALAGDAFHWQPFRFARGLSRTSRGTGNRSLSPKHVADLALKMTSGELDGIWFAERSDARQLTEVAHICPAFLSIKIEERSFTGAFGDPPNTLACTVSMVAEVSPEWPSLEERRAVLDIACVTAARYGCVFVGTDLMRARSESVLVPGKMMGDPDPPWATEIHRMARYRHQIGDRVRGAYWGNFLSDQLVEKVGGAAAVRATGASVFERVRDDLTYAQVTLNAGEALTDEGIARMARLRALLEPVVVGT